MEMVGEAKFTPGPWKVQPGEVSVGPHNKGLMVGPLQYANVHVVGPFEAPLDDETRANARLIAAAPDLAAFANLIIHYNDVIRKGKAPTQGQWEMFVNQARAAITRATTP